MEKVKTDALNIKNISFFDEKYPVKAFFTDKEDNKRLDHSDDTALAAGLESLLDIRISKVVTADATHSGSVFVYSDIGGSIEYSDDSLALKKKGGYDSVVTDCQGVVLCLRTADCVPVFFYDTKRKVVAMAHSGWRGTVSLISSNTLKVMKERFSTAAEDVIIALGPGICGDCYEVGEDLKEHFMTRFSRDETGLFFRHKSEDKYLLDIKAAIRIDLIRNGGIRPCNIYDVPVCTLESRNYPSYRREGRIKREEQILSGAVMFNKSV